MKGARDCDVTLSTKYTKSQLPNADRIDHYTPRVTSNPEARHLPNEALDRPRV